MTATSSERGSRLRRPVDQTQPRSGGRATVVVRRLFAAQTPEFFFLLGTTLFLMFLGLVMVLSSSYVESRAAGNDPFSRFLPQMAYAAIGLPLMLLASRMPGRVWRALAWPAVIGAIGMQALVVFTPLGTGNGYNKNWLRVIGSVQVQPSEFLKLALVLWLAMVLARKQQRLGNWAHVIVPVLPVAGLGIGLVLMGGDLGTVIIVAAIVLGAMFFGGVRLRMLLTFVVLGGAGAWIAATSRVSRANRVSVFLTGCSNPDDYLKSCFQTVQGWWALAHGGLTGVGLGNSTAKWSWLPEASNDFIFAIIGEELGAIGAVTVLALFVVLTVCFVRIIRMQQDAFAQIATSAVMVWLVGQALVNIGVVIGVFPVLGVPLPLVSAGGSALITSMFAVGIVLSFARNRPEPGFEPAPLIRVPRRGRAR